MLNKENVIKKLKEIESSGGNVDESTPIEEITCQHEDFEWCYLQGILEGMKYRLGKQEVMKDVA